MSTFQDVPVGQVPMRSTGCIAVAIGIISLGINAAANNYVTNIEPGAWWASIFTVISGLLALRPSSRGIVISTCVISGIAAVLSFVGAILDGIDNDIVKSLEACASGPSTLNSADITLYGNSDYFSTASLCYINNVQTYYYQCYCVNTNYGVTSGIANECYLYDGQSDCTNILEVYPRTLSAAVSFDVFSLFAALAVSICSCMSLFCPQSLARNDAAGELTEPVVTVSSTRAPMAPTVVVIGAQTNYTSQQPQPTVVYAQPVGGGYSNNGSTEPSAKV